MAAFRACTGRRKTAKYSSPRTSTSSPPARRTTARRICQIWASRAGKSSPNFASNPGCQQQSIGLVDRKAAVIASGRADLNTQRPRRSWSKPAQPHTRPFLGRIEPTRAVQRGLEPIIEGQQLLVRQDSAARGRPELELPSVDIDPWHRIEHPLRYRQQRCRKRTNLVRTRQAPFGTRKPRQTDRQLSGPIKRGGSCQKAGGAEKAAARDIDSPQVQPAHEYMPDRQGKGGERGSHMDFHGGNRANGQQN